MINPSKSNTAFLCF